MILKKESIKEQIIMSVPKFDPKELKVVKEVPASCR